MKVTENARVVDENYVLERVVEGTNYTTDNGNLFFYENDKRVGLADILLEDDLERNNEPLPVLLKLRTLESYEKGYGRKMISYLLSYCKERQIPELFGACATGSEGFYTKMGAELVDGSDYYGDDKRNQVFFSIKV